MSAPSESCVKRKADNSNDCQSTERDKKRKQDLIPEQAEAQPEAGRVVPLPTTIGIAGQEPSPDTEHGFLHGIHAYILVTGIGKSRTDLFTKQLKRNGGVVHSTYHPKETTHVIADEKMDLDRLRRIMKLDSLPDPSNTKIVKSLWLSSCLKAKELVDSTQFEFDVMKYLSRELKKEKPADVKQFVPDSDPVPGPSKTDAGQLKKLPQKEFPKVGVMFGAYKKKIEGSDNDSGADSDYVPSDNEEEDGKAAVTEAMAEMPVSKRLLPKGNWVCAQSSTNKHVNQNKHITDKLEALAKTYENTNDRWRALGYQKAIMVLRKHPTPITTWEEAKSLPGVGARLADKIWEIVESGELRKLDELSSSEEIQSINLFTNIWGAGAHTARTWVQQGFRTLEDVRTKANLTRNQKIGLKHYDEFLDRMPRSEAGEIEAVVKEAAMSIEPGLIAMACGSYRRGKPTCGDVDVLVTHPDGKSHRGIFHKILTYLHNSGFLTDDLVHQEDVGNQKKYLGVCKLPGENTKHRRLDIIVVPYDEFACALMYFTGSAHFNRSMRNLAGKMNMSLSEHALCTGVVRKGGEKLNKGTPLPTPTEESVFQYLGLKYRLPEERDH